MSRKIQVVVPDPIADEVDAVVKEGRFSDYSEYLRSLIRDDLNRRYPKTASTDGQVKAPGGMWETEGVERRAVGELGQISL